MPDSSLAGLTQVIDTAGQRNFERRVPISELEATYGDDRKFIWSVARALQLLQAFRPGQGALGNAELSERTGIAKATVTRLTYTLTELGYLRKDKARKFYPAPSLLSLGFCVLGNMRIRQMAQSSMQELAELAKASVALSCADADSMIYVAASSSKMSNSLLLDVGSRVGMATTASGRAYLACLPEAEQREHFDRWRHEYGPEWPDLEKRIMASLDDVRRRGYCIVDREWRANVRAVAAPVYDAEHDIYMALNCGGPAYALSIEDLENEFGPRLVHIAHSLGWKSPNG
ncbi:MAG: IclR family transcriptional regulator [Pseudochelatococcus sp.]|uniref:IclR family transcriptional regulator n=1 Tax=Pseudochelatococcus sp. TaxID=2020869 RepID=UPI003D8E4807